MKNNGQLLIVGAPAMGKLLGLSPQRVYTLLRRKDLLAFRLSESGQWLTTQQLLLESVHRLAYRAAGLKP